MNITTKLKLYFSQKIQYIEKSLINEQTVKTENVLSENLLSRRTHKITLKNEKEKIHHLITMADYKIKAVKNKNEQNGSFIRLEDLLDKRELSIGPINLATLKIK